MSDMAWVGTPRDLAVGDDVVRALDPARTLTSPDPELEPTGSRTPALGRRLRMLDVAAVAVANLAVWGLLGAGTAEGERLGLAAVAAIVTVLGVAAHGLYRARACAVRSVELVGLARSAALGGLAAYTVARIADLSAFGVALVATGVTFLALAAVRGAFVAWLRRARTQGRYCRSIVVVGAAAEAERLVWLLRRHPELGLRPVGLVGDQAARGTIEGVPWLGGIDTIVATLALVGANGVVIASGDLDAGDLNTTVRALLAAGVHVQLSSGIWGIDQQRLRPVPLAHEPF